MSDTYIDGLRRELVAAAAREQAAARPGRALRVLPPLRPLLAFAAAAALVALVLSVVDLAPRGDVAGDEAGVPEQPLFGGTLEPGVRYASQALQPPVSFRVFDREWMAAIADRGEFLLLIRQGTVDADGKRRQEAPPRAGLGFGRLVLVTDPRTGREAPPPRDLIAWITAHPDIEAGPVAPVTVSGIEGRAVDLTVAFDRPARRAGLAECPFAVQDQARDPDADVACTQLTPGGGYPNGVRTRWIVLDTPGDPFLIEVIARSESDFRRALEPAQRVLDSLRIAR